MQGELQDWDSFLFNYIVSPGKPIQIPGFKYHISPDTPYSSSLYLSFLFGYLVIITLHGK